MTLIVDFEVSKKEKLKGIQFFSNPKPSRFYGFGSKYAANTDDQSTKVSPVRPTAQYSQWLKHANYFSFQLNIKSYDRKFGDSTRTNVPQAVLIFIFPYHPQINC